MNDRPPSPTDRALAALRSLPTRARSAVDALRAAGVIGPLARVRVIRLLVRTSGDRVATARAATTACAAFVPPTAADVLGQYLNGNVLFGTEDGFRWRCYEQRFVIDAETARLPRRIRRDVRNAAFEVRFDVDFDKIIRACASREEEVWLTPGVIALYEELHELGSACCIGCYRDGELVGGLWGHEIGRSFVGMSMFHTADSAGTTAVAACVEQIGPDKRWDLVDVGVPGPLVNRFGVEEITLADFQRRLVQAIGASAPADQWSADTPSTTADPASP